MKRIFWLALGLGAGATGAVLANRAVKKQAEKMAPANVAKSAQAGLVDLSKRVAESIAEGKKAMDEREREIREAQETRR
jgi:hypothetical protein